VSGAGGRGKSGKFEWEPWRGRAGAQSETPGCGPAGYARPELEDLGPAVRA
jgi:hypothetical protein